jgi:two-component system, cell cycle sensor histidine kinase and response regulator CckA
MVLERLGYKVFMARSGQEAIEVFRAHQDTIDLVILDMIMPGMEGGRFSTFSKVSRVRPRSFFRVDMASMRRLPA